MTIDKTTPEYLKLRNQIKKMAESRGYRVLIEKPTLEGDLVEVGLFRNEVCIAIEVSVAITEALEVQNIQKYLNAGFNPVILCSTNRKILEGFRKIVKATLDTNTQANILFLDTEGLLLYLDQLVANELNSFQIIKGYKVKVEYRALAEKEAKAKWDIILKAVSDSERKRKK